MWCGTNTDPDHSERFTDGLLAETEVEEVNKRQKECVCSFFPAAMRANIRSQGHLHPDSLLALTQLWVQKEALLLICLLFVSLQAAWETDKEVYIFLITSIVCSIFTFVYFLNRSLLSTGK